MYFTRRLPARAALATVTAAALVLTATACGGSSSKRDKSRSGSAGSHSGSHRSSSGSGLSKTKDKKKKRHRTGGLHRPGSVGGTHHCRGSQLSVTVNKRARSGGYLELAVESARNCTLPAGYADVAFGTGKKIHAAHTRSLDGDNHRIRVGPSAGTAYVGLRAVSTGKGGTAYPEFELGADGVRPPTRVRVPGGVKVNRPLVTGFREEAGAAVPGTSPVR